MDGRNLFWCIFTRIQRNFGTDCFRLSLDFLISKLVNSQAAALAIVVPMALSVGVDPLIIISFISACYGYFFLPTYPSDLACIGFDCSGTTRIGRFVINHSFIIPGLIGITVGCCVGYVITHLLY